MAQKSIKNAQTPAKEKLNAVKAIYRF